MTNNDKQGRQIINITVNNDGTGSINNLIIAGNAHGGVGNDIVHICDDERSQTVEDSEIHVACRDGRVAFVKHMLDQAQVDINVRDKSGRTPLMTAAAFGQKEVFDLLVRRGGGMIVAEGADVSLMDKDGKTVRDVALMGGHADLRVPAHKGCTEGFRGIGG